MAVQVKVGSVVQKTSTGNQSYTGIGFTPQVIIFYYNHGTADGSAAGYSLGMGYALSASSRVAIAGFEKNGNALPDNNYTIKQDTTKCVVFLKTDGTPNASFAEADIVSMDADGFTLNWTTADAVARRVGFIAIAGLVGVKLVSNTSPTSTGNQSYTGVGFRPDGIMIISPGDAFTNTTTGFSQRPQLGLSFAVSTAMRAALGVNDQQNANPSNSTHNQQTNKAVSWSKATDAILAQADLVSMDSDGFTLNWGTVDASARPFYTLCFKGAGISIGSANQPTSNSTQTISGLNVLPKCVLLASTNNTSSSSASAGNKLSLGATDGTNRFHIFSSERDNVSTGNNSYNQDSTKIIKMMTENGSTPTTQAVADISSVFYGGFTLNWTTTDATAREFLYLVIGDSYGGAFLYNML